MNEWIGIIGFSLALLLALFRVPIAVSMILIGSLGSIFLMDWNGASYILASLPFEAVSPYSLSVVPLFIFMGVFASHAGISENLFKGISALMGHRPGGLASASIGASAIFGAICGSSLATCATIGRVAMPEMQRHGYPQGLAGAAVAAGGTLGVLIPPSILLIIYALLTEQSIGALFAGAIIPGLMAAGFYIIAIRIQFIINPDLAPRTEKPSWRIRMRAILAMWDAIALVILVIGGIYMGFFDPNEAAAIGAGAAILFTAFRGRLSLYVLATGLRETAILTGMIFLILIGASIFNFFIEASGLAQLLVQEISQAELSPHLVLIIILCFYILLGCFMDSLSMLLLTVVPVAMVATNLGFDPIWLGVIIVSVVEIGLITPPVGMNLFVISGVANNLSINVLSKSIIPFILADFVRIALLVIFTPLILFLPTYLGFMAY